MRARISRQGLATWLLLGCAAPIDAPTPPTPTAAYYECGDFEAVAYFTPPDAVTLFLPGRTVRLHLERSASGARYAAGNFSFWTEGDEAVLRMPGGRRRTCVADPSRTPWEEAKLRGVHYRAVGNEPGWALEIAAGGVRFLYDYGASLVRFPPLEPEVDEAAKRTLYRGENDSRRIEIVIEGVPCRDPMSGESFETRARVALDEAIFEGCGRALH
jgi:uncharacterized membrane protein/membrane-bound inhibitor of C-type lysozyme